MMQESENVICHVVNHSESSSVVKCTLGSLKGANIFEISVKP
jgi:hypothetical protein